MSSRISNEDMDQRVEFARQGWTVPGAYLVQEYDDGRQLNRMLDETVAERNQLSAENEQLRAQLAAVPVDTIRRIVDAASVRGKPLQFDMDAAQTWLVRQGELQP